MTKERNSPRERKQFAVIGGGWAGCACAVELAGAGHRVTLLEAARTLGGRARAVEADGRQLDNGQHILLGAYADTLRLLGKVGIASGQALLRLPLQMRYAPGCDGMDFLAPRLPAPLHMLVALLRATGLTREDKMALARFSSTARWMGWTLNEDCSVTELLDRYDQTDRLIALMWRPLCIAALNTPPERASAQVFLNVLRDSLGAKRSASDMLIPRLDLSMLFPARAADFILAHGGAVRSGFMVKNVRRADGHWLIDGIATHFDGIAVATHPAQAAALLGPHTDTAQLAALRYEPITTCYLQYEPSVRLPQAMFALRDDPASGGWGQFVFDRGWLEARHAGMLAVVISAAADANAIGQEALATAVAAQLAASFDREDLGSPDWTKVISEKRATFSCTPGLARPDNATGVEGLVLAGDYTAGEYPATLEAAVRSGTRAAQCLTSDFALQTG
jgi:squalene-associated FAD-dependent desaturase